eukprot:INCI10415.3.p1 GENE.INCI10415.3~~INCI10415.3.p1  ORF type:complete len:334 (+),score=41.92 INCI10415.3:102-1103(+)
MIRVGLPSSNAEGVADDGPGSGTAPIFTILLTAADFDRNFELESPEEAQWNILCTVAAMFIAMYTFQFTVFVIGSLINRCQGGTGPVFGPYAHRVRLGRHVTDTTVMIMLCAFGYEAMREFGGLGGVSSLVGRDGEPLFSGLDRANAFNGATQRLCVGQIAYQIKNFIDSWIHNDGWIFLVHHTVTALLSGLSCRPYLHIYCAYFLGWSEVSTVFLCLLVFFDKNHGIQYFADKAPNLLTAIGVAFACSFIVFRIVLWPYVNYFFWVDMYDMLIKDQFHNRMVGAIYCIVSAGLTILQFYWLGDIVHEAKKHFGGSTSNPAPVPNESSSKKGN